MEIKVAALDDIARGGLKVVEVKGARVTLCNVDGKIFAVERRCGHMNAPLELGSLNGVIITCPLHHAQFDVTTGKALCGPMTGGAATVPRDSPNDQRRLVLSEIGTEDLKTYKVVVRGRDIFVDV